MTLTVAIYRNGMSWTRPDSMGARAVTIGARPTPEFEGLPHEAAAYLEGLPIGLSVEARYYRQGKFAGSRSCVNKPALWLDVASKGESA
jgi:hypothetical protein